MQKWISSIIPFILLAACQPVPAGGLSTVSPEPTVTILPIITLTQSSTQTITYRYSNYLAPGVAYGPPSLSESVYLEAAGGSGRDGLKMQTGMTEEELVVYEQAAYDGAAKSGYSKDKVDILYLYDPTHLSWNMVLRLKTGEYLWSRRITDKAYSTFPL